MLIDRKDLAILILLMLGIIGIVIYALIISLSSVQALIVGIALGNLFSVFGYWIRKITEKEERYRKLLEDCLKDYLGPIYGILFNLNVELAMLRDNRGGTYESLNQFKINLERVFMGNFGVFALILPKNVISLLMRVRENLGRTVEGLKKNMVNDALINRMLIDMWETFNRFSKLFGLEYIEKLDKAILDPSLLEKEIS